MSSYTAKLKSPCVFHRFFTIPYSDRPLRAANFSFQAKATVFSYWQWYGVRIRISLPSSQSSARANVTVNITTHGSFLIPPCTSLERRNHTRWNATAIRLASVYPTTFPSCPVAFPSSHSSSIRSSLTQQHLYHFHRDLRGIIAITGTFVRGDSLRFLRVFGH